MQTDPHDYNPIRPQELPYLKLEALEGRPIPLHTFHDGNRWHLWFPMENGLLQPIRIVDAVEMVYLAPRRDIAVRQLEVIALPRQSER